jgi:hypothetical protein
MGDFGPVQPSRTPATQKWSMIGRSMRAAMLLTICSVNAPGCADVPITIVGATRLS